MFKNILLKNILTWEIFLTFKEFAFYFYVMLNIFIINAKIEVQV